MSVGDNIGMLSLDRLAKTLGWIPTRALASLFRTAVQTFNIKVGSIGDFVTGLSGGNQQKVMIARSLSIEPMVIMLDDPTSRHRRWRQVRNTSISNQLTSRGCGVIMTSSELPEVLAMSDRVIVMYRGRIRAELDHEDVDRERIMSLATGVEDVAPQDGARAADGEAI